MPHGALCRCNHGGTIFKSRDSELLKIEGTVILARGTIIEIDGIPYRVNGVSFTGQHLTRSDHHNLCGSLELASRRLEWLNAVSLNRP